MKILAVIRGDAIKKSLMYTLREFVADTQIRWVKDLSTALTVVDEEGPFRFIFIQSGFTQVEYINFIGLTKKNKSRESVRFILLVSEGASSEEFLSQNLSLGFSGVLIEPFSVEAVRDVMQLSSALTMAGSVARLTVAAGLQIKAHLVGERRMSGGGGLLESVKKACQIFEKDNPGKTVQSIAKDISELPLEQRSKVNALHFYKGVSERVRQLVSKRERK